MPYIGQRPSKGDENNFKILDDISSYTLTFDGSDSSVVSAANDTITSLTHRFVQGQRVTYTDGGGSAIAGLTDGTVYYIIKHDHHNIKLATSASNAANGTAVNITNVGSGASHTINVAFDGVNTKFKATHTNGQKAKITRSAQLVISINGVIQQPHDTATPSTGFGFDLDGTIVFSQAPVSTDEYWAHVLTNNNVTFDISDNDIDNFTGDGSTTEFNLSKSPPDNRNVLVTIDGVVQYPNDPDGTARAYVVVENVLTFNSAPASGVEIQVRHIGFAGSTSASGGVTNFYGRTGSVVLKDTDNISVNDAAVTGDLTVTGNMTVNGDFTTLNTTLREVELLKVDANSSTTAGIITQRGSGDILNLFDSNSEVLTVTDGGQVGINSTSPSIGAILDIGVPTTKTGGLDATVSIASTDNKTYPTAESFSVTLGLKQEIEVGGTQPLSPSSPGGYNFITGITNFMRKKNGNVQDVERSYYAGLNQNFFWNDENTLKQYRGITDSLTYFGSDANGRTTNYLIANQISVNPGAGKTQTVNRIYGEELRFQNFSGDGGTPTTNVTHWSGFRPALYWFLVNSNYTGTITDAVFYDTSHSWGVTVAGSGSATHTISNLYGLRLRPPGSSAGLTITNNYGVYQEWSSAKNYFAGNVGIGITNPTKLLELKGTDPTIKLWDSSGDAYALLEGDSADEGSLRFRADPLSAGADTHIRFDTDGTERVRITSTGRVGIGTDTPGSLLNLASNNPVIRLTDTDSNVYSAIGGEGGNLYLYTNSSGRDFIFRGTTEVARITGDGTLGIGTHTPDRMLHIKGTGNAIVKMEANYSGSVTGIEGVLTASGANRYVTGVYGKVVNTSGSESNVASIRLWNQQASPTTSDSPGYITFNTTNDGASTATEKLRIKSNGYVGINSSSPAYPLDVLEPTNNAGLISITGTNASYDTGFLIRNANNPKWYLINDVNGAGGHSFEIRGDGWSSDRFFMLTQAGKVGIGTNNPLSKLHVANATHGLLIDDLHAQGDQGIVFTINGDANYKAAIRMTATGTSKGLRFMTGGFTNSEERLRISPTGKITHTYDGTAYDAQYGQFEITKAGAGNADPDWSYLSFHRQGQIAWQQGIDSNDFVIASTGGSAKNTLDAEKLRITSDGNLRLGLDSVAEQTDSAHYIMTLTGKSGQTGAGAIAFKDPSANTDGFIFADGGNLFITADYSNATADSSIRFRVDGSGEKLRIESGGGLKFTGKGTSIPVGGILHHTNNNLYVRGGTTGLILGNQDNTTTIQISNGNIKFETDDGTEKFLINSNGHFKVTNGSTSDFNTIERATTSNYGGIRIQDADTTQRMQIGVSGGTNNICSGAAQHDVVLKSYADLLLATNQTERLRIKSDGKVGINADPTQMFEVVTDFGLADNLYKVQTSYRSGNNASGYTASGLQITSSANNNNGEKHTAFLQFSNRDPALNGSHGASAFITMSTPSGTGTYGTGQFDFYCRHGAPYAFPNDPQAGSSYWMDSLFTIKSNGNVGVNDTSPAARFVVNNGTNNAQFVQMKNEEVGLFFGAYGTGTSYPREATINGSRIDSGSLPFLRIAGQGGIKFCVDLNTPRAQINSSGHFLVGNSTTQFTTSAIPVVFGSGSGTNGISIYAGSTDTSFIHFADGTIGAQRYAGGIGYSHSDEQMNLSVNDTTRVRIHDSNFREIIFPQQHENTYAQRVYRTTVSANANSYTKFATVSGPSYGTHIKMSTTSTIGNVVTTGDFEIKVGHSNDVLIISKTLAYTNMSVKVITNGNQNFDLYIKRSGGHNTSSNSTHKIAIHPQLEDTVVFNSTIQYTGQSHEHTTSYGALKITGTGGPDGNIIAAGSVTSNGSKPFKIKHPLESLSATKDLVHAAIEGPQVDLIYRGKIDLVDGTATINLDTKSRMTEGTFVLLNRDVQCFTTNETGWTNVKGSVSGNILTIIAQDNSCTDTISWMVIGERQDDSIKGTSVTDADGKLIMEPLNDENVDTSHLHKFYPTS